MSEEKYYSIPVSFLLRDQEVFYEIYISINGRYIQYTKRENNSHEELQSLKMRGVDKVFVKKEDYKKYIDGKVKERNPSKNKKEEISTIDQIAEDQELLRDLFSSSGFDDQKVAIAKKLQEQNVQLIKKDKTFSKVFEKCASQKRNHSSLRKLIVSSIVLNMVDLTNMVTEATKEKFVLAILLDGLSLNEKDYWLSFNAKTILEEHILAHPNNTIKHLPNHSLFSSPDIINFIKYYRERPDGSGYPLGIKKDRMSLFLAIIHTAEDYVSLLLKYNLKTNKFEPAFKELEELYIKFKSSHHEKALGLLSSAMKRLEGNL